MPIVLVRAGLRPDRPDPPEANRHAAWLTAFSFHIRRGMLVRQTIQFHRILRSMRPPIPEERRARGQNGRHEGSPESMKRWPLLRLLSAWKSRTVVGGAPPAQRRGCAPRDQGLVRPPKGVIPSVTGESRLPCFGFSGFSTNRALVFPRLEGAQRPGLRPWPSPSLAHTEWAGHQHRMSDSGRAQVVASHSNARAAQKLSVQLPPRPILPLPFAENQSRSRPLPC